MSLFCDDCGGIIIPGQPVTRENLFAPWRHKACPSTTFDFDPADVCPDCFTVRATNGKCAC